MSYSYNNYSSALSGTGNISSDPNFVDSETHDYRLEWPSNSINTADPNPTGGLFNWEDDPLDMDSDETRQDMGVLPFNFNGCGDSGDEECSFGCTDPLASNYLENAD